MVKKGQYQYYHISLYKCNEKHDGTYIEASFNVKTWRKKNEKSILWTADNLAANTNVSIWPW